LGASTAFVYFFLFPFFSFHHWACWLGAPVFRALLLLNCWYSAGYPTSQTRPLFWVCMHVECLYWKEICWLTSELILECDAWLTVGASRISFLLFCHRPRGYLFLQILSTSFSFYTQHTFLTQHVAWWWTRFLLSFSFETKNVALLLSSVDVHGVSRWSIAAQFWLLACDDRCGERGRAQDWAGVPEDPRPAEQTSIN
jgi:hypothetical protein